MAKPSLYKRFLNMRLRGAKRRRARLLADDKPLRRIVEEVAGSDVPGLFAAVSTAVILMDKGEPLYRALEEVKDFRDNVRSNRALNELEDVLRAVEVQRDIRDLRVERLERVIARIEGKLNG